jgi:hypothetical protein
MSPVLNLLFVSDIARYFLELVSTSRHIVRRAVQSY